MGSHVVTLLVFVDDKTSRKSCDSYIATKNVITKISEGLIGQIDGIQKA